MEQASYKITGSQTSFSKNIPSYTHESRIEKRLEELESAVKKLSSRGGTYDSTIPKRLEAVESLVKRMWSGKDVNDLKAENEELKKENRWMAQRVSNLEKSMGKLIQDQEMINDRLNEGNENSYVSGAWSSLEDQITKLKSEVQDLKPSSNPRKTKFQNLVFMNLTDMHEWLTVNNKSFNYSLIVDLHTVLEHVHHQINPSKSTLELLQAIKKIDIPTANHAVTIQSYDHALPKFFYKAKDHKVIRGSDSLCDNIKTYSDWDEPNYGFRDKLTNEILNTELAIENAIREEKSLTDVGKSVLLNALSFSLQGVDVIVRYVDKTHRELIRSNYTPEKAWHLVTLLITRVFLDVFEPRVGKLNVMETKNAAQVAIVVFHSSFESLEVLKSYKDHEIGKHPNIASEYVKFISHNTPYQLVETLQQKVKKVEDKFNDQNTKLQSSLKQLNTTTQKAEKHETKLSGLESRVAKLEKK